MNSPTNQNPLKVSVDEAIKELEDCENKGAEISDALEIANHSNKGFLSIDELAKKLSISRKAINRYIKQGMPVTWLMTVKWECFDLGEVIRWLIRNRKRCPAVKKQFNGYSISITRIKGLKNRFANWSNAVTSVLGELYADGIYQELFNDQIIDEDLFSLNPQKLYDRIYQNYATGNFRHRLESANSKEGKIVHKEIKEAIGSIKPHWDSTKTGMINNLQSVMKAKMSFLLERLVFLEEFGEDSRVLALEIPIEQFGINIVKIFSKPVSVKYRPDDFNEYWEEAFRTKSFKQARLKIWRKPKRPILKIDSFLFSKDDYLSISDELSIMSVNFEKTFAEKTGLKISKINVDWSKESPEYDYSNHGESFERLKDFAMNLIYIAYKIPSEIMRGVSAKMPEHKKIGKRSRLKVGRNEDILSEFEQMKKDGIAPNIIKKRLEGKYHLTIHTIEKILADQRKPRKSANESPNSGPQNITE